LFIFSPPMKSLGPFGRKYRRVVKTTLTSKRFSWSAMLDAGEDEC